MDENPVQLRPTLPGPRRWAASLALLAALVVAGCQQPPPLESFGPAPEYQLVDQAGTRFGSADLGGKVALVDFIYTNCTDVCPTLTANLAQVQRRLKEENLFGSRVLLVSISVDPMHDIPPVLSAYAQRFGADAQGWKFLTGDWDQVYETIAGFKVGTRVPRPPPDAPPPGGTEITHTTRLVVVDPDGQVRAFLRGDEATPDEIVSILRRALRS